MWLHILFWGTIIGGVTLIFWAIEGNGAYKIAEQRSLYIPIVALIACCWGVYFYIINIIYCLRG